MLLPQERHILFRSVLYPLLFVVLLWVVYAIGQLAGVELERFGLLPRSLKGLTGIVTFPLIHGDLNHLISNSLPLLVLGWLTFYFYRPLAFTVFFWVYLMSGIWLWAAGRDNYHIGASGLVYGFAAFLFFSGIFRKDRALMVLSMLVVFLYGSMVWGIFPFIPHISWESHLLGALAGVMTAFYYRKEGPQTKKIIWNDEDVDENGEWNQPDNEREYPRN